jgi:hypothetical protein
MTALYESVAQYRADLDALADLDIDDPQTIADTIECMAGALQDKLRAVIAYSLELDIEADGAGNAAKRMQERAKHLEARSKWLQAYALQAMQDTGIAEVATDEFAAKIAKTPPRVVIADDAAIPIEYLRTKTVTEPDKTALKAAIQAGTTIQDVYLVTGFRLAIR